MDNPSTDRLPPVLKEKWDELTAILSSMQSVLVAFSGGVDSALVSTAAYLVLGNKMAAVTVESPVEARRDVEAARKVASRFGFTHHIIPFDDLESRAFVENPPDRCYHCKRRRMAALIALAGKMDLVQVADGSNAEDAGDYRPGMRALAELGVRSPLAEAGLRKGDIRAIARASGIETWDRPSAPCLATRFPYGTLITRQGIARVARAEEYLQGLGYLTVRVRDDGSMARLEVPPQDIERLASQRECVVLEMKALGYTYVALDLIGYRSGSMNEVLEL